MLSECVFCRIARGEVPDVAHVHAHVAPMHEKTDITSARYIVSPTNVSWSSEHLRVDQEALERERARLA
jgi:diadenosine tetraphosphate (Ap4A) HIT family hydrolase